MDATNAELGQLYESSGGQINKSWIAIRAYTNDGRDRVLPIDYNQFISGYQLPLCRYITVIPTAEIVLRQFAPPVPRSEALSSATSSCAGVRKVQVWTEAGIPHVTFRDVSLYTSSYKI